MPCPQEELGKHLSNELSFQGRKQAHKGRVSCSGSHSWHPGLSPKPLLTCSRHRHPSTGLSGPTFRLRMLDGLASDLSMTWMSWSTSSPAGRGRVTSSATSLAASSSWRGGGGQAVSEQSGASPGGLWGAGRSHSPAANAQPAACTSSRPGPRRSWQGPPSPPRSSTPPGCNAA